MNLDPWASEPELGDDDTEAGFWRGLRNPEPGGNRKHNDWFISERELAKRVPCPDCRRGPGISCTHVGSDEPLNRFPAHTKRIRNARKAVDDGA